MRWLKKEIENSTKLSMSVISTMNEVLDIKWYDCNIKELKLEQGLIYQ